MGLPVLRMGWVTQPFVHWAFDVADVQRLLPPGLTADEYDGRAWVSLTPFVMAAVRPPGVPAAGPVRWLATFPETNLRTYVRGPDGRDGLWFLSIEVSSAAMALVTRGLIGAPYHLGDLSVTEGEGVFGFAGTRRGGRPAYRLRVRPGEPLRPTERDVWLTSRWRAYTRRFGTLLETPVEHEPWPLRTAVIDELDETLTAAAGLPRPPEEPLAHYSPGVEGVRIAPPRLAGPHRRGRGDAPAAAV